MENKSNNATVDKLFDANANDCGCPVSADVDLDNIKIDTIQFDDLKKTILLPIAVTLAVLAGIAGLFFYF